MRTGQQPAEAGTSAGEEQRTGRANPTATPGGAQPPRKWLRVLGYLYQRGERGLNRFEAAREVRDHVLPTTISQFEDRGVKIARRMEVVPGFMGAPTDCARYWIAPESRQRARELLGQPNHDEAAEGPQNALAHASR